MEGKMVDGLRFVEAETPDGESVEVGEWNQEDGSHFLDLDVADLLELATGEDDLGFIVLNESVGSYKIFFDEEKAKAENRKGYWKKRALYPAEIVALSDDG